MEKQPHLQVGPADVHEIVLLPGDPGRVDRIAEKCQEVVPLAQNREYKVMNAVYQETELTLCSSGIGSPSAAIAVEELNAVGVETVIRPGTTGALQGDIEIGDMVVATAAGKDEGTSKRYESATLPAVPDYSVLEALVEAASAETDAVHVGPIVTDDAFYAETEVYVRDWEAAGMLAVEMEAAAVFTLARRNGMRAGAICTVDGNLVTGDQKGASEGEELPPKARNNVDRMIDIALEAVTALA